jgi:hypothetical protein
MFVKDSKIVFMLENVHQHYGEEEKEKKIQVFSKKLPASWTRLSETGQMDQIYVDKIWDTHII